MNKLKEKKIKKIKTLESIEDYAGNEILAWENNDKDITVNHIYLVVKINEIIERLNEKS